MARLGLTGSITLLLTTMACGPAGPAGDTSSTGDGDGDTSSTSSTGDGDGDGDGGPGDGDGGPGDGDGAPLVCPAPEAVTASFTVTPDQPLAATCAVIGETIDGTVYEMTLDCEGSPVTVSIDSTIAYLPSPGPMVEIDYRVEMEFVLGFNRWLAIHDIEGPMGLVLGGVASTVLDPSGTTLAEFFREPGLSVADEQPCEIVDGECGQKRRLALAVTTEFGTGNPVFDHGSWFADFLAYGYWIEVEQAWRWELLDCADMEPSYFSLLAVWFPSD